MTKSKQFFNAKLIIHIKNYNEIITIFQCDFNEKLKN